MHKIKKTDPEELHKYRFWIPGLLFILQALIPGIRVTAQALYSSPNPKTMQSFTQNDMLYFDYSYFTKLNKDLSGGIRGSGVSLTHDVILSVYVYDNNMPSGKGHRIYRSYARPSDFNDPTVYHENITDVFIWNSNNTISGTVKSNNILQLAQNERKNDPPLCDDMPYWKSLASYYGLADYDCIKSPGTVYPVIVEIETDSPAAIHSFRVPGIVGDEMVIEEELILNHPRSRKDKYCADHPSSPLCMLFNRVRNPVYNSQSEDIMVANHRGYWGYNLGNGEPENSKEAATASFGLTPDSKIIEMDLLNTEDNKLIMLHDYVLKRLTDYAGDKYPFQMTWDEMKQYHLRRRNGSTSPFPVSQFTDVLDRCVASDAIFMIDIKDKQSKGHGAGCTELCEFQSEEAKRSSWKDLCNRGIDVAGDRAKNIVVKTYYSATDVRQYTGERFYKILWTPMIVSSRFDGDGAFTAEQVIQRICDFVDQWQSIAGDNVAYYETNFFKPNNPMLKPFQRNGIQYRNLLEYIYVKTQRRTGVFSEEPAGPKGVVNRWGDWKMKDPDEDKRTDPYFILDQPYGNIMVITTDRSDVWKMIKQNF